MRLGVAVALAASLAFGRDAHSADRGHSVGAGTNLCAEFTKAYAENNGAEDFYWSWAMGMMSGMNLASVANSNIFRDLTADQDILRRATRSFCIAHPLTPYSGAILDLYVSLPMKKTTSK